ncbi:MAG: DUF4243 domain-containing protein [Myxococcales bacterium]|nr:MAG: DUF4243 domain-containing protein [Myxococcales bacterium]
MTAYGIFDEALESIADGGPDLRNGLTNHAPMVIEALCAMGRDDAVTPWLDEYRRGMLPWPDRGERIDRQGWRLALGRPERATDWLDFFANELQDAPWSVVLDRWTRQLAAGICAAATHGVIRVGHAARALALAESPPRTGELAAALASWASTYQVLPTDRSAPVAASPPAEAILQVPIVPPAARRFTGTITSSLEALHEFPPFASTIGLAQLDGDPSVRISELAETFVHVYLANAKDPLGTIVFVHGVTSMTALRSIVSHVSIETTRESLLYAWQAGCGLYAAFGKQPLPARNVPPPDESNETLIDMAIANGDEHAIKFTEACLGEHALTPNDAYPAAAHHAIGALH